MATTKKPTPKKKTVTKKKQLIQPAPVKVTFLQSVASNEVLRIFGYGYMVGATVWTTLNLLITTARLLYWSITH